MRPSEYIKRMVSEHSKQQLERMQRAGLFSHETGTTAMKRVVELLQEKGIGVPAAVRAKMSEYGFLRIGGKNNPFI